MRVVFSPQARRDVNQAAEYIAADSLRGAERFTAHLAQIVRQLAAGELNGPEVRLHGRGWAQRWSLPPYRIYYRRTLNILIVLRGYHQARRSVEVC